TLVHVPIQGTDWEMAVLIREGIIQDQIRDISEKTLANSRNQIIFTTGSVLALAVVLLFQSRKLSRDKLKAEKETSRAFKTMANTDSLTGIRNKHAYAENEALINQQIQSGAIEKLAVVIGDINGLKYVNDTQGHAAGDQLIKDASEMLCKAFSHGAVFRIGGDEFVILLQGEGFDTMDEVIGALNRRVEANIKAGKVVVSIGYAVLTPQDRRLGDVFERADNMMYERKKALKHMGAKTREN
ncbi:MAG: GGDEF domain-containing protein, partial [Clostridia bacterium]|nr:GGDEF domain-containing protein [Clostridia bacterium]